MRLSLSLSFVLLFLCTGVFSQRSLTKPHHSLRDGDSITKYRVEYKEPGRVGTNVLWDFSKLHVLDEFYTLDYQQLGDSLIGAEHNTMYYYGQQGDTLLLHGYENQTTLFKNIRPEVQLTYPLHYGDSIHGYYQSKGKYCNELLLDAMGTVYTKADAYGMLVLPGGDTLTNVLRVYSNKLMAEGSSPYTHRAYKEAVTSLPIPTDSIDQRLAGDTAIIRIETFRWYERGYRYPVFETVRSTITKSGVAGSAGAETSDFFYLSFFYPPEDHHYLYYDPENLALLEEKEEEGDCPGQGDGEDTNGQQSIINYNMYISPSGSHLVVEYLLNENAEVSLSLHDMQGNVLTTIPAQAKAAGGYSEEMTLTNPTARYYLVRLVVDGEVFTEVVSK